VPLVDLVKPIEYVAVDMLGNVLRQLELFLLIEKSGIEAVLVGPAALLLGNMDQLQSDSVLFPPVSVVDVEYHDGEIIVVVIFLLVRVVLLPPSVDPLSTSGPVGVPLGSHLDDAIKCLLTKNCFIFPIQLEQIGRVPPVDDRLELALQ